MNRDSIFRGRIRSFGYAFAGIATLVRTQPNARIHLIATLAVVGLGFVLGVTALEWAALFLAIGLVFSAEAFNSAVEVLADKVQPEQDPAIKVVKDVAAGGVLLAAMAAALVGMVILLPKLLT